MEKEVSISDAAGLWRFLRSLVNAVEIVALMSRFVLYSFFFSSFLFFSSGNQIRQASNSCRSDTPSKETEKRRGEQGRHRNVNADVNSA